MLQCGYRSTCIDIKLRKLKSMCSADIEACAQIESSESGPLSMKSLLLRLFKLSMKNLLLRVSSC